MKYYLVARTACVLVGIEQCRGYIVGRSLQATFEKEFAGRILLVTAGAPALPGIGCTYRKGLRAFPTRNIDNEGVGIDYFHATSLHSCGLALDL